MNSRRASHKKKIKHIVLTGLVLVALVFLAPRLVGSTASFVLTPVTHIETMLARIGGFAPDFFKDRVALINEIEDLKKRIAYEGISDVTTKRLMEENKEFRRLLGANSEKRTAASVIGRPTVTPYDVLVLDKGTTDGIQKFAPVYIGVDQAVGYVAEVFPHSAVVTLLSTPGFETSVYIYGPNIYTTARGIGGGVLEVSVPQGILLQEGDPVIVPTLGSGVYGRIDVVNSVPSEPEQRGYVALHVPLQSLRFVSVGINAVNSISFEEAKMVVDETKKNLTTIPVPSGVLVEVQEDIASSTASTTAESLEMDDGQE